MRTATLDVDATLIRAAKRPYDGNRGYQPVLALRAEQAGILADEFRDGKSLPSGLMGWMAPSRHLCAKVRLSIKPEVTKRPDFAHKRTNRGQTTNLGALASGIGRVPQRGNPSRFSLAGRSALPIQRHQQGSAVPSASSAPP